MPGHCGKSTPQTRESTPYATAMRFVDTNVLLYVRQLLYRKMPTMSASARSNCCAEAEPSNIRCRRPLHEFYHQSTRDQPQVDSGNNFKPLSHRGLSVQYGTTFRFMAVTLARMADAGRPSISQRLWPLSYWSSRRRFWPLRRADRSA